MAEDNWWSNLPYATAASAKASALPQASPSVRGKAKTTPQDMKELVSASEKAKIERSVSRQYEATERAVKAMGTGPFRAKWLDAILPDEDEGFLGSIGSTLGIVPALTLSQKTLDARDQLKTVAAQTTLAKGRQLPGGASDKDTALMRMAGITPYKSQSENLRILKAAKAEGRLSQARALFTSSWIGKYGSMANAAPRGMTFEEGLSRFERQLAASKPRQMPKAPPSVRRATARPLEIDMNGNPIR